VARIHRALILMKLPIGLFALCLAGACATGGVHPDPDLDERRIVASDPSRTGVLDSTFTRRIGACAGAVQDTFVPNQGGAGFSRRVLPEGCWPALDSALSILPDATVRIAYWFYGGLMSVEVSTAGPVHRHALASYLRRRLGLRVVPNSTYNRWPPVDFERVAQGWQFTLMRGYGDCLSGCAYRRYFPFLYVPSTGRVKKLPEHGDPWPPPPEYR